MMTSVSSASNLAKLCMVTTLLTNSAPGTASLKMSQLSQHYMHLGNGGVARGGEARAAAAPWIRTSPAAAPPKICIGFFPIAPSPSRAYFQRNRRGGTIVTTALRSTSLDYYTPQHDEHDVPLPDLDLDFAVAASSSAASSRAAAAHHRLAASMVGGIKYEMIPLPDSMVETTIFVGNLDEFVTDSDLSDLFSSVSTLCAVPSVVARKVDSSSLRYGFVTFPSTAEREEAIRRFDGAMLEGCAMRVEAIRTVGPRVRVPGKLVAYAVGEEKESGRRRRRGEPNTLRKISVSPPASSGERGGSDRRQRKKKRREARRRRCRIRRISTDDVLRLSRGQRPMKKGYGSISRGEVTPPPHRLSGTEMAAFERAGRSGYVTLDGTGYRRGRRRNPLANVHRGWCDARAKPQIVLCRASGGRMLDNVVVDLSPLRVAAAAAATATVGDEGYGDGECADGGNVGVADEFLTRWKAEILSAARSAGMELVSGYVEDNTEKLDVDGNAHAFDDEEDEGTVRSPEFGLTLDASAWATEPIWRLPMISVGVFEGERSKAKEMAKTLSSLWETKEEEAIVVGDGNDGRRKGVGGSARSRRFAGGGRGGGRTKMKGLREHRRR